MTIPDPYRTALVGLRKPEYFRERRHLADLMFDEAGADPRLVPLARAVVKEFHRHEIPLRVFDLYRGRAEQEEYLRKGTTRAAFGESPHNFGLAFDLIHATKAWDLSRHEWELIKTVVFEVARRKKISLTWGGSWSFYDPAHYELANWKELKDGPRA